MKTKKHTKVMRYEIIKPLDSTWEVFGQVLRQVQYETRHALNKSIQLSWEWQGFSAEYKRQSDHYPNLKEITNYTNLQGYAYNTLKHEFPSLYRGNFSQTVKRATDKWNSDRGEILRGERSIPNFKKDIPIDVVAAAFKEGKEQNLRIRKILSSEEYNNETGKRIQGYTVKVNLISDSYKKELGRNSTAFEMLIKVGDNTQKAIIERLIEGKYNIAASQILYQKGKGSGKKGKWFLNLSYSFEKEDVTLNPDLIMGIDMGIVHPIYIAFSDSYARYHINKGEINRFRNQIEKRKKELLHQGTYCGEGRKGHGIQARIKPIEVISDKIANFRKLCNHRYSKFVVDIAVKHGCGTIQMEDLQGISKDDVFYKNWSYFDLQEKIAYKAKESGIKVIKVNPRYTSQRCSQCGNIDSENRVNQADFLCTACGFKALADYNAARNISTRNIEKIIDKAVGKEIIDVVDLEYGNIS
ncbi:IS605 OrfB family transposase [Croceifilum oryzae]|uniref:IS605 OrfB family transposase n=1 Tax=Croceifilum oryzae TaxID=1553429 RepID=A0AAJ1WUF3_9BACL|nr:transposase [Croceifilum oryzae]MDQ0417941.1 IS605 OrfB family transposase [Croceifilum oryzae]